MKRPRYPDKFKTKRELLWYVKGLKDAKVTAISYIEIDERRYLEGMQSHMDFDKDGNVLPSTIQPTIGKL